MVTEIAFSELETWLASQPANTPQTPYELKITGLTANDLGKSETSGSLGFIIRYSQRYVCLSETVLPFVESLEFSFTFCSHLLEPPILPEGVKNLIHTFSVCSIRHAPVIPESVTNMRGCFYQCSGLSEPPAIPSNVETMEECFYQCNSLTTAPVLPNGLKNLANTFAGCFSITEAPDIPESVTEMYGCFTSTRITEAPRIPNGVVNLNSCFYSTLITEAPVLPPNLQTMSSCFAYTRITEAPKIPKTVTSLYRAFYYSRITTPPVIPDSVINMSETFCGCSLLTEAPVLPPNLQRMVRCFVHTRITEAPKIPSGVKYMSGAFASTNIEVAPVLPEGLLAIGSETSVDPEGIFSDCYNLVTVPNVPSTVTNIEKAFANCYNLEEITSFDADINSLLRSENAFYGCTSLTKIGIPKDVPEESDDWHVMSIKIGASTVEGKIYDRDGNDTDINEGTAVSITKDTLTLPVYTDELLFPPSSLSDADLETLILKVLQNKYTWFKKETIDPENKSFVLWADDPANFKSNVTMDMPVYPTLSALEADLPNLSEGQLVAYEQGGDGLVDAVTNGDMRGVTSNAVFDALNTVTSGTATLDPTYVTSGYIAWVKKGNVCELQFNAVVFQNIAGWSATPFATGIPKPQVDGGRVVMQYDSAEGHGFVSLRGRGNVGELGPDGFLNVNVDTYGVITYITAD